MEAWNKVLLQRRHPPTGDSHIWKLVIHSTNQSEPCVPTRPTNCEPPPAETYRDHIHTTDGTLRPKDTGQTKLYAQTDDSLTHKNGMQTKIHTATDHFEAKGDTKHSSNVVTIQQYCCTPILSNTSIQPVARGANEEDITPLSTVFSPILWNSYMKFQQFLLFGW